MEYHVGQVVFSKSGHDKGDMMLIVAVEGTYVYLADGKRRRIEKPKRKKIMHIQPTWYVNAQIREKLENGSCLLNAEIAKVLKEYREKESNDAQGGSALV